MKVIISFVFSLIFLVSSVAAVPGDWWGTVKIVDSIAPDGTEVSAHINNSATAVATTTVGEVLSGYYLIHVVATSSDVINFKVCGIAVEQAAQPWSEGDHPRLDLTISEECGAGAPSPSGEGGGETPGVPSVPSEDEVEEAPTECPTCPSPTEWSECIDGKQTRTNYRCSAETNYECEAYTEEQTCEITPTLPTGLIIAEETWTQLIIVIIVVVVIIAGIGYWYWIKTRRKTVTRSFKK